MHSLHFPIACSMQRAMARPFKHSPFSSCVFSLPPSLPLLFLFIFSPVCAPHHQSVLAFYSYYPSSFISLPSCSLTVWISLVHVHASVFLPLSPSPSLLSSVISLSYVCPSLYVCVPPLFVSDSFSREIRDAYLVPLFSTGAAALSYTVWRWPRRKKPHPLIMCSSYPDQCQRPHAK